MKLAEGKKKYEKKVENIMHIEIPWNCIKIIEKLQKIRVLRTSNFYEILNNFHDFFDSSCESFIGF